MFGKLNIAYSFFFFFQAEDGIRAFHVTGVQTCALPISLPEGWPDEELIGLLPITGKTTLGYGIWVVVDPARGVVVGSAGFVGDPQDGGVELGYGIHPSFRGLGY